MQLKEAIILLLAAPALLWGTASAQSGLPVYQYGTEHIETSFEKFDNSIVRKSEEDIQKALDRFPENPLMQKGEILQAQLDFLTGNYNVADGRLSVFLNENPNSPFISHASILRAYIAFEQKNYKLSDSLFNEAYKISTGEYEMRKDSVYKTYAHQALYWRGISLCLAGKYQSAQPVFEDCYTKYPNESLSDDALYAMGMIAEIQHKFEIAVSYYSTIAKKYPYRNNIISSRVREVNNRLILRDASAAIAVIENAEIAIDHIKAQDSIGKLYEAQNYTDNTSEDIHYLKGEAYNISENYPQALLAFGAYLETFKQSRLTNYARLGAGWALLNQNDNDSAITYFNQIIADEKEEESPVRGMAQLYHAVALKRDGKKDLAQSELSALAVKPAYPYLGKVLLELGQIYYEVQKYEEARRTLERADREASEAIISVRVHILLGSTYAELRNWSKAITEYTSAEQLAVKSSYVFMPQKDWYIAESRLHKGIALAQSHRFGEAVSSLLAFLSDSKKHSKSAEGMFWLAESYYRLDLLKNAIETYKNLLELYPEAERKEESYYGIGWAYFRQKEFEKSSEIFDKMIKEFPESKFAPEVLARQADGYYHIKNWKKAAEAYKKASSFAPRSEEGQYCAYQLCHALYRQGALDQAISALLNFVKMYPRSNYAPYALYLNGWIRFQQKNYEEAIDHFKFLTQSYPQHELAVRSYYTIGDCYYNSGKFEEALESYRIVVQSYTSDALAPEAMKGMQYSLTALGREDEATKIAESYIETNPKSPFAEDWKFKRGEIFYTGKKYSDAISEYEAFMKKFPGSQKNDEALYWMGKSYVNMNDEANADKTFREIQTKYPNSDYAPLSMLEQGLMNKQNNKIDKAVAIFTDLMKKFPTHQSAAQAGFERAEIKYQMGDTVSALDLYRFVAYSFPGSEYSDQSYWRMGMHYRNADNYDSAKVQFVRIASRYDNEKIAAEAQFRIGELYMRQNKTQEAINAFLVVKEKFSAVEEWYPLAMLSLGECYEKLEKINEAIEIYNIIEATNGEDDYGKTVKLRLKRLKKE
jgi:tol-pal system protein YbgF